MLRLFTFFRTSQKRNIFWGTNEASHIHERSLLFIYRNTTTRADDESKELSILVILVPSYEQVDIT